MKTAISIPDAVYETAEKLAHRLGKSRSQLYSQAVSSYIAHYQHNEVTEQLNQVYTDNNSRLDEGDLKMQIRALPKEDW